jgi:hypothetical protein
MAKKPEVRKKPAKPPKTRTAGGRFHDDQGENDQEWSHLLDLVDKQRVVPFLGAGACYSYLPLASDLAQQLADAVGDYPFEDRSDLAQVAQYAAVMQSPIWVKGKVVDILKEVVPPSERPGGAPEDEPHRVLARLPFELFMTTNYDRFLVAALTVVLKLPRAELCRWNNLLVDEPSVFEDKHPPSLYPATPVVFHLHGRLEKPESLVLTADDYLRFLAEMIRRREEILPGPVRQKLRASSLLFVGYRLADWNFRLLLQSLQQDMVADNYIVLLPPKGAAAAKVREYQTRLYTDLRLRVFWGTAQQFCGDLASRHTRNARP